MVRFKKVFVTAILILLASTAFAAAPTAGTIMPASGTSVPNAAVNFTTTFSDTDGWQNIQYVYLLVNKDTSGANCCYVYYDQNSNKLYIRNDFDTLWLGGYAPGSSYIIENSCAKLDCSKTTISGSGTTLTVKWNITFKTLFASVASKKTYLYVKDDQGAYNGWLQKGTWKIIDTAPAIATTEPINGKVINAEP